MLYSGLYFFEFNLDKKDISIFYSSILLGLSLFLRLEFIFPIFSWIIVSLLYKKFSFYYVAIQFGIAFLTIIISLFIFNFIIYGHPLGFRYLLTMTNPEIMMIPRSEIITDLLFGRLRGFFYQSPYLLLFLIIGTFQIVLSRINKKSICKEQEFYFLITIFILLLISFTAPNHGDHLSPRYLFGIYPSFFLFSYYTYNITKTKLKRNFLLLFHLLIIVLILFSVKQLYKNIKFISDSDKLVRSLTDKVSEQKEQNIVFLDQVLAKNLQTINYTKNLYYSKPEDISNFLKVSKIDKSNILFISTEYSSQCILDFKLCKDRNSFNSLNFYKYQDN
ncbi:MAG: hypothetical protein MH321_07585 [Leptospiraceae bacterium]|nr:hypothetical protein [Leptospiraceae bacterium]